MSTLNVTSMFDVRLPRLRWHCQVCGQPIESDTGYVELSADVDGKILYPTWRVVHRKCDDHPEALSYWVSRGDDWMMGTLRKYLREFVAHVQE